VYRLLARFAAGGWSALRERPSAPIRQPRKLAVEVEDEIVAVRRRTSAGPQVIGVIVGRAASTVGKVLRRRGESRLPRPERDPVVRYERERPGELVHVDSKKLGCFWAVGKRILADGVKRSRRAGWQYLHVAIDVECPRFGGQLSAGLSGPAERLSGHAKEAEVPEAVSAGVSA
jgi:hypothetical protein